MTLKIYEGEEGIFKNTDDAIKYMEDNDFKVPEISVYDSNTNKAYGKQKRIYERIKEYNRGKPLNSQILPSNPFYYRGIIGCLGIQVCSITLGFYDHNHHQLALFTGWNSMVLDTSKETPNICADEKAMAALSMLGSMWNHY